MAELRVLTHGVCGTRDRHVLCWKAFWRCMGNSRNGEKQSTVKNNLPLARRFLRGALPLVPDQLLYLLPESDFHDTVPRASPISYPPLPASLSNRYSYMSISSPKVTQEVGKQLLGRELLELAKQYCQLSMKSWLPCRHVD